VSLAGPLFGLLAAIPFFGLYFATGEEIWAKGAAFIGFINLLNLAPIPPLDGSKAIGPVLARFNPQLERLGMLLAAAAAIVFGVMEGYFFLAIFVGIAVLGYLKRGLWRPAALKMTWREAGGGFVLYLMAVILCGGTMLYADFLFHGSYLQPTALSVADAGGVPRS
jgi:Zn-dependent protease